MYCNDYLDEYDGESNSPVYYKLLLNRDELMTVACLQDFDECDYNQDRFFKTEEGRCVAFYDEDNAKKFLNEKFKPECIDPEYRGPSEGDPNKLFRDMLR